MYKRAISLLFAFALLLCAMLPTPAAFATDAPPAFDPNATGELTISYIYDEYKPLKHVDVALYHVATLTETCALNPTTDFTAFDLLAYDLNTQQGLLQANDALEQFIALQNLAAHHTTQTNYTGEARIELPLGLYYVKTDPTFEETADGETNGYYTESFLVIVGGYCPETGDPLYDYVALPKISVIALGQDDDTATHNVTVEKIWKNTQHTTVPKQLEIKLFCDGECFDTVILNAANKWKYTWENLDADCTWAVKEATVLEDYTVHYASKVTDNTYTFTITNTFTGEPDPTPTPKPGSTPPPTPPPSPEKLPQTGSNLPYVPVFAGLGLGLIVVGILLKKGGDAPC